MPQRFFARAAGVLAAILIAYAAPQPAAAREIVTDWTIVADRLGRGNANWRTMAIMHRAMHDAVNAAVPTYARWHPAEPDEPRPDPDLNRIIVGKAALAASARQVLMLLHPNQHPEIDDAYARAVARVPDGPAEEAGTALGTAIATAAVRRRAADGFDRVRPFSTGTARGQWRLVPDEFRNSSTTDTAPFLFARPEDASPTPPPPLDSAEFQRDVAEVRAIGGTQSAIRTPEQVEAASYWYYQSTQRGLLYLGVALVGSEGAELDFFSEVRVLSQLATAMADSAIVSWWEKEHFLFWRPITMIREDGPEQARDVTWEPLIETPPHPDYPSGHAADCYTGTSLLQALLPNVTGPVSYVAQPARPPAATPVGTGQVHRLADSGLKAKRTFPSLAAMAQDCADSRIWAGAHFRAANEESRRIATVIRERALAAVPRIPRT